MSRGADTDSGEWKPVRPDVPHGVDGESLEARPDVTVRVSPGEAHSFENTGEEDLVLVSLNLPA